MSALKFALLLCLSVTPCLLFAQGPPVEGSEVAPGIHLPPAGTLYALDQALRGPKLQAIHASEILANTHAASNFARGIVYAGPHSTIEVFGENAPLSLHTTQPVFYMRLSADDPEIMRSRVTLLRLYRTKERRVVIDMSMNVFGGQKKRRVEEIPLAKSDMPDEGWVKLIPQTPLESNGEYAFVFMPKDPHLFPDTVYDFDIVKAEAATPAPNPPK
jgi:hypothetical protein